MKGKLTKKKLLRQVSSFSLQLKQETVKNIEKGICTVLDLSRELQTSQ